MKRTLTPAHFLLVLIGFLAANLASSGQDIKAQIPQHPRELKYSRLDFTPPKASTYHRTLSNGVAGYFVEDHDLPLINISITIRVGTYLDPVGKAGLAAAVGSQLRAGGTLRYKAEDFDEEADFLAANISSFIGGTSGSASINFLSKDVDKALDLFFDMLRNPAFQQDRLELYKSQQLQQIERRNDQTDEIESREWNRLLRGEKHFTNIYSTKDSLSSINRDDLFAFFKRYYQPANFIFAVSGDFGTDEMKLKLETAMAGWVSSGAAVPAVPKPDHDPVPGVYMVNKPDVNQGRVSIGHIGIMRGNPDVFAIDMMNEILGGGGFTSRIMNRVRSEEGLAYDAGSSFVPGIFYPGLFRVGFQSKSTTAAQAAQIVLDEVDLIRKEQVSSEELDTVKNNAIEVFPRYFATASAVAGTFAYDEFTERDPRYWETYRDKIRAVTVEDVLRVARNYLHPDKLVILAVGNNDEMLKANSEKPQYSFEKMGAGRIQTIPLPDPQTMIYPKQ